MPGARHVPPDPRPDAPLTEPRFLRVVAVTGSHVIAQGHSYELWRFAR